MPCGHVYNFAAGAGAAWLPKRERAVVLYADWQVLERQGRGKRQRKLGDCGGKAWTHKELKALEDGLVCLGAGRVADLRAQVPSPGQI